jgi:DNA-directed RNA polymerase subunit alpha
MMAHLKDIAGVTEEELERREAQVEEKRLPNEMYETPIENLDLSVRVFNSLKRTGITTVGEVLEMLDKGPDSILSIRNFGDKSLDELKSQLQAKGFLEADEAEAEAMAVETE